MPLAYFFGDANGRKPFSSNHYLYFMRLFPIYLAGFIISMFFFSCQSDEQRISRRWVFTDLQTPSYKALAKAFDPAALEDLTQALRKKVQGNRLILDKNGECYGVLMNKYITGKWDFSPENKQVITHIDFPKKIDLKWLVKKNGYSAGEFEIDAVNLSQMNKLWTHTDTQGSELTDMLDRQGAYTIIAEPEADQFDEKDADPWSPALNKWRLRPMAAETEAEIKTRVRNHLHFMYSFFSFAIRGERYWVSQDWFFSVIKPGNNGMALLSVKNIPGEWYQCFYDSSQAMEGYGLLRKTFHYDIEVPKESNSIVFNKLMLEQLLAVYDKKVLK